MNFDTVATTMLGVSGKPPFLYGTAWKKERTTSLVKEALAAGFRAVDTAAQPKHYQEELVGDALREAFAEGVVKRKDVFVQTKFTSPRGQDHSNMPYDMKAPLESQIHTSLASSLQNLRPQEDLGSVQDSYIDCLVLHSPLDTLQDTLAAWKLFESYVPQKIRRLGISNTDLATLKYIHEEARVKPSVVQNRFYPRTAWDADLRLFCAENGIMYQSFWTLTGNPQLLRSEAVRELAQYGGVEKEVALYALVMGLGVSVLNGTTNVGRMKSDLEDLTRLRNWSFVYGERWRKCLDGFKKIVGGD